MAILMWNRSILSHARASIIMMMSIIISRPPCRSVPPHVRAEPFLVLLLLEIVCSILFFHTGVCSADIIFSEIADQGTTSSAYCEEGKDWLELYNTDVAVSFDLSGLILHDDQGVNDTDAYTFPPGQQLAPGEYLVLCMMDGSGDPLAFPQFKIGGSDTVTLFNPFTQEIVASLGPLPNGAERAFDVSYAWNNNKSIMSSSTYMYTKTPTPGSANIMTPVSMNKNETTAQIKERLKSQNALGTQFFGMDDNGLPVPDRLDDVLDLHLTMEQADYDYLMQNASFQLYSPFTSARVTRNNSNTDMEEELLVLNSPGRIRAKGQSSLFIPHCMGKLTLPFQVEFNTVNKTQTLYGVEKIYLRTHFMDGSYMRDWSAHRMLARFGLPHLRARKMRFFINGNRIGLYTVLEAVDLEHVFARSFPNYTPESYALYKVKTLSIACGMYEPEQLERTQLRFDESSTPPYAFERGDHREPVTIRGPEDHDACYTDLVNSLLEEYLDVELAYLRYNQDCGEMVVNEGLVDLDLGVKDWDSSMIQFFNSHLGEFKCDDEACQNSNLSESVDIENFLKSFAFYAVTVQMDSPLGNGNNYYLAETGDGTGWKIVGYDHNHYGGNICGYECNAHLPSWSILRPTCGSLHQTQLAGPLLSHTTLHTQYIEYVRAFTNDVLGNVSFVEEMTNHLHAIQDYVIEDYWSERGQGFTAKLSPNASDWNVERSERGGQFFADELSPNASDWEKDGYPLIPFYKARVEEVRRQLESLDNGFIPRKVEPFEVCVDWYSTEPPQPNCPQACRYEGCQGVGLFYILYCDEMNGVCYQGEKDPLCEGIPYGERYDGMENKKDGRETMCAHFTDYEAVKLYECHPFVDDESRKMKIES